MATDEHNDASLSGDEDVIHSEAEHAGNKMYTAGYRDGISNSDPKVLQEGFNDGFEIGKLSGQLTGQIYGAIQGVKVFAASLKLVKEADDQALECLKVLEELESRLSTLSDSSSVLCGLGDVSNARDEIREAKQILKQALEANQKPPNGGGTK
jgi:hypothetical protein